ncbi:SCO6745 family protein [Modestobacter versicolor]|uniref:SCO6745 family protein n=1 Tax=Modestobacter versicolor TaxID=429133 RepID=UPI0034DF8665
MVSVDQPSLDLRLVARTHRRLEPLHSQVYFAPETGERLTAAGLRPGRMGYFAGRAAPLGAVGPGVVTATFYNFAPSVVARHLPRAWTLADPEQVLAARHDAARASLTRLLGDDVPTADVAELAELLREACGALTPEGRPLYAAHADLPWPADPVLQVWHGVSLLREHRGDGHVAVLLRHRLTGLEALVTHTLTGRGFTRETAQLSRGWSAAEWDAAAGGLADRGLVADGALTPAGIALREALEQETDELSAAPFAHLGTERTERVGELAAALTGRVLAAGAFPAGVFATR